MQIRYVDKKNNSSSSLASKLCKLLRNSSSDMKDDVKDSEEGVSANTPLLADVGTVIDINIKNEFIGRFTKGVDYNLLYFCDERTITSLAKTCKNWRDKVHDARKNRNFSQTYSKNLNRFLSSKAIEIAKDVNMNLEDSRVN